MPYFGLPWPLLLTWSNFYGSKWLFSKTHQQAQNYNGDIGLHTKSNFNRLSKKNFFEEKNSPVGKNAPLGSHFCRKNLGDRWGLIGGFFREVTLVTIEGGRIQERESFHKICNLCVFKN